MNPVDADLCPKCGNSLAKHSYFTQQAGVLFMCPPSLELPTEPTWGIAIVHTHKIAYAGKWMTKRAGDQTWLIDVLPGGITTGAAGVTAFIPLTAEQVRQIEAAR